MTCTFDENLVSDLHKDAFGYRPREYFWAEWNNSTDAQKQVIWDDLLDDHKRAMDLEAQEQERAVEAYRQQVQDMLALGAQDEYQARKWIVQALKPYDFDLVYGGSWVCWSLGLPYSMKALFDQICRELLQDHNNPEEEELA